MGGWFAGSGTYDKVVETPFSTAVVFRGFYIGGRLFLGPRAPATDCAYDGDKVLSFADGGSDPPDIGHLADEAVQVVVVSVMKGRVVVANAPVTGELHSHNGLREKGCPRPDDDGDDFLTVVVVMKVGKQSTGGGQVRSTGGSGG